MKSNRPVTIANTDQVDFQSAVNGRRYSLSIAMPLGEPPKGGFPALYVLDSYWYYASAVEASRAGGTQVVVVGVGYPDDEAYIEGVLGQRRPLPHWLQDELPLSAAGSFERQYDLSLPASDEVLKSYSVPGLVTTSKEVGGLDDFLKTIEVEVKPRVAALAPINASNQAIFGHSLGGLAVVHALFTEPRAFRTFIASSPSIWWSEKAVLAGEAGFAKAVKAGAASPRVLITMGSEEETADPKVAALLDMDFGHFAAFLRKHRMVENARELTQRLRALPGAAGFEVEEYAVFSRTGHGMAIWCALARGIPFAFP